MTESRYDQKKPIPLNGFLLALMAVVVFLAFIPSLKNEFVNWDDPAYVLNNPLIRQLSLDNIAKMFSSFVVGSYHPLTTLSFAFDYSIAQFNPAVYHAHNLILHIINALLVFFFARQLTGNVMAAFLTSLMFGLHPTRVESVAWITERKDVLFGFFYLLGLNSYLVYLKDSAQKQKLLIATFIFFVCSLLSKPAAVSFPLILLLVDYYKKGNISIPAIFSKAPFFILSAVFGYITFLGGYSPYGNTYPPPVFNFVDRIVLCAYTVGSYGEKLFFPVNLTCFYPYPLKEGIFFPAHVYLVSFISVGAVWAVLHFSKFHKLVVLGLGFFLAAIFFNLPLFGIGYTIMADRFTYLPYVGIFLIVSSGIVFLYSKVSVLAQFCIRGAVIAVFIFYFFITLHQCQTWQNDLNLWGRVLNKQPPHALVYYNFANALFDELKAPDLAQMSYSKAIELYPSYFAAYNNRGNMSFMMGNKNQALKDYNRAIELNKNYVPSYLNRAEYYIAVGQIELAVKDYEQVLILQPSHTTAKEKLDKLLAK